MPFTIKFRGLICHVLVSGANPPVRKAILVKHIHHEPRLIVPIAYQNIIPLPPVTGGAPTEAWFDLTKNQLTVDGVSGDPAKPQSDFDSLVTPLRVISDATAHVREIGTKKPHAHPNITSSVTYGGGTLTVTQTCEFQATFAGRPPLDVDHCVADTVVWSFTPTGPMVRFVTDSGTFDLPATETITVRNFEAPGSQTVKDFGEYKHITNATSFTSPTENTALPCSRFVTVPLRVECSNTQYP